MPNKPYELIEHTADIGIKVKGKDLKSLFINFARAMFDIIAEKSHPEIKQTKKLILKLKADKIDELLVLWLNELLSLSAVKELIFSEYEIIKLEENYLEAQVSGEDAAAYKINTEIKAATYHELEVKETNSGWQARLIFDV
jgi:SHS2 domain-containing protein